MPCGDARDTYVVGDTCSWPLGDGGSDSHHLHGPARQVMESTGSRTLS